MCPSSGLTIRRGAGIIGNALGDFFGVTEVSQRGNTAEGRIGWEQYTERRVEEVSIYVCSYKIMREQAFVDFENVQISANN